MLIEAGADVNKQCEHGRTALRMAAACGDLDVVTLLMNSGADPTLLDDEGMRPPMVARKGYSSNRVSDEERRGVGEYFNSG